MSKKTIYLLGILITIILGTFLSWKYCCTTNIDSQKTIAQPAQNPESIKEETPKLSFGNIDENGNINFSFDNIKFKKSSMDFSPSFMSGLDTELSELKDFVVQPENEKALSITGYYMSDETNNSIFPNIGLARAIKIKNYMSSRGIPTKLIDIYGELNDTLTVTTDNTMEKPIKFSVGKSKDYSKLIERIMKEIEENPLVLEFDSGRLQSEFTSEQRIKIVNISTYLDKVDNANCLITGHTDNTGSTESNLTLGLKRANFLKDYIIRSGISENKVKTTSKGESSPVASNKTEAGRQKNRRATVSIN
ncbi:OmpA family protein [Tenacibaculum jejuense]|uniref:OmpA/MotB domain protein n=1 Tax=Tenacibaculum jejuense TaxID=584609 RepID=A0A238UEU0_9FLAO|nr:OmpA family protein [Tenacibaculum jejuense]SNR16994.1 OmpA/MotB domain protein [Tenacibaculum jejuense]